MTLNFPGIFPPSRDRIINFNWSDINSGVGYVLYDLFVNKINGTNERLLILFDNAPDLVGSIAVPIASGGDTTSSTFNKLFDLDYDSAAFQRNTVVEGDLIIRYPSWGNANGDTISWYFVIRLRKWDGSAETEIVNVQSDTNTTVATEENTDTIILHVPTTIYKKGDKLRITLEAWAKNGNNSTQVDLFTATDPGDLAGSNFSAGNSRSVVAVPFKINL